MPATESTHWPPPWHWTQQSSEELSALPPYNSTRQVLFCSGYRRRNRPRQVRAGLDGRRSRPSPGRSATPGLLLTARLSQANKQLGFYLALNWSALHRSRKCQGLSLLTHTPQPMRGTNPSAHHFIYFFFLVWTSTMGPEENNSMVCASSQ